MKPRISMITLGVADVARSVAFYRDGFGFPLFEATDSVAFFDLNGSWLGLYGRDALAADAGLAPPDSQPGPADFPGFSLAHNLESKAAVDAAYAEAVAAGAAPVKPPQDVFWGGYSSYVADPDGYLWEIALNPHAWIGPRD